MNFSAMVVKIWGNSILRYVTMVAIAAILIVMLWFWVRPAGTAYFQDILDTYVAQYQKEFDKKMEAKDKEIKEKDKQITNLDKKYKKSQAAYTKTKAELDKLRGKIINVKEPKDLKEIKDRLKALGYTIR